MSDQQRIEKAFADAAPDAGGPDIAMYPGGAFVAKASRGEIHIDVRRTVDGATAFPVRSRSVRTAGGLASSPR